MAGHRLGRGEPAEPAGEPHRAPAPRAVGIARDQVDQAVPGQVHDHRGGVLVLEHRRGDLHERTEPDQAREVVLEVAVSVPLGVGDHAAEAPRRELLHGRVERFAERPRGGLEQDPAAAASERHGATAPPRRGRPPPSAPPRRRQPRRVVTPRRWSSAFRSATLPASSPVTTSWSCLMWGVAQIVPMPSASASRAMATRVVQVARAVVERGKDVAVEVDHAGWAGG